MGRADFFLISSEKLQHVTSVFATNVMRQSACLVFNPITVKSFASLFNCTPVGRTSDPSIVQTYSYSVKLVRAGPFSSVALHTGVQLVILFYFRFSVVLFNFPGISSCHATRCICRVLVFDSSWYFS